MLERLDSPDGSRKPVDDVSVLHDLVNGVKEEGSPWLISVGATGGKDKTGAPSVTGTMKLSNDLFNISGKLKRSKDGYSLDLGSGVTLKMDKAALTAGIGLKGKSPNLEDVLNRPDFTFQLGGKLNFDRWSLSSNLSGTTSGQPSLTVSVTYHF